MSKAATRPPRRARDILRHYLDHPQSADTLEGIAGWRLLDQIIRRQVIETEEAVRWLVDQAFLERRACRAAPPVYRLNPNRRAAAERLLGPSPARAARRRTRS